MSKSLTQLLCVVIILGIFSLAQADIYLKNKDNSQIKHSRSHFLIASWYGAGHHGKISFSGKPFNMYALTAAHKQLPMGTVLRVTNLSNMKSIILTITDRGPFIKGRDLDLSYEAAKRLGMVARGKGRVKMELAYNENNGKRYVDISGIRKHPETILEARFEDRKNALKLMKVVASMHKEGISLRKELFAGKIMYRVAVAGYEDHEKNVNTYPYYVNLRKTPIIHNEHIRLAKNVPARGVLLTLASQSNSVDSSVVDWGLYSHVNRFSDFQARAIGGNAVFAKTPANNWS
jgi:rare lipoprotein A